MASSADRKRDLDASTLANRRALAHQFAEFERARAEREAADARVARFAETIQLLLAGLPETERGEYAARFETLKEGKQRRGGEFFGNVVSLFKRHPGREWSVPAVQEELKKAGREIDPKQLYNTINYLTKTGHLHRVSRGRYAVRELGFGIDIEGIEGDDGTNRPTEHDN